MSSGSVEGAQSIITVCAGGLLHGFEEGVGGGVGKPVGVVEDDDAPFANGGEHGGGGDDFGAHGFDANGEFSGG